MKREQIQTEVDAATCTAYWLSRKDEAIASIFRRWGNRKKSHALAFLQKSGQQLPMPAPSMGKNFENIGKVFGNDYILGVLMDTEKGLPDPSSTIKIDGRVANHDRYRLCFHIAKHTWWQCYYAGINGGKIWTKAQICRGNVVKGSSTGRQWRTLFPILVWSWAWQALQEGRKKHCWQVLPVVGRSPFDGIGEWISVKSSQELYENQMELEMEELEANPEGENEGNWRWSMYQKACPELMLKDGCRDHPGQSKGPRDTGKRRMGINAEDLQGSAMEAAVTSLYCSPLEPSYRWFPISLPRVIMPFGSAQRWVR